MLHCLYCSLARVHLEELPGSCQAHTSSTATAGYSAEAAATASLRWPAVTATNTTAATTHKQYAKHEMLQCLLRLHTQCAQQTLNALHFHSHCDC
jgi:hypothetical protein